MKYLNFNKVIIILCILIILFTFYNTKIRRIERLYIEEAPDVIIMSTMLGKAYANRIKNEMELIKPELSIKIYNIKEITNRCNRLIGKPKLIIARAATPFLTKWMICLKKMEANGTKVVNPTNVLQLTSNKLKSSYHFLNKKMPHPYTKDGKHNDKETINTIKKMANNYNKIIIKPYTSSDQGKYVQIIDSNMDNKNINNKIKQISTPLFVIQEYIPYVAIYRVIVINNKALPLSYKDVPNKGKWKVSVCLNKNMQFVPNPNPKLLRTAEKVQRTILNGGVHFIDLFELKNGDYTISEVNTACSLLLHERKARQAKHPYHNIAKYLAQYYVSLI